MEHRIRHETLLCAVRDFLEAEGVPSPVRDVEAEVMSEADLMGVPSHGVRMLPALAEALRDGRVKRDPQLKLIREKVSVCVLDGDNGPGRYTSVRSMQYAIERAKTFGAGVCLTARTTHWGRAHAYACRAARSGMIGICATNAMPSMLIPGSSLAILGNNPLAIAVPRGPDMDPVVLDMAMTQAAVGKVGTYLREGKKVPLGWGLDAFGNATDDPAAILSSRKFLPVGDHKGYGLALMLELLTAALAGGMLGCEIVQIDKSSIDPGSSKIFLALDIEAFVGREEFFRKVQDLLARLGSAADPGREVRYPGERGWRTRDRFLAQGIPIHPEIVAQLREIGMSI